MRSAHALGLGVLLALTLPGARGQDKPSGQATAKPTTQTPAKPATPPAKPAGRATAPAAKPAAPAAKPAAPAGKPAAQAPAKPGIKASAQGKAAAKPRAAGKKRAKAAAKPARKAGGGVKPPVSEIKVARRDPFESLIGRQRNAGEASKLLPPGKAGLQVSTLRLDGVVRAPNGMIAVVTNPQSRTYFLREGDQLYDGRVEKIMMDSVSFHEVGKDAFGKPVERQVNKRIYASAGEQQ